MICVSTEWQWMGSGCEEYKMKKGPKVETSSTINVGAWGIRPECRFLPLYQIHQIHQGITLYVIQTNHS